MAVCHGTAWPGRTREGHSSTELLGQISGVQGQETRPKVIVHPPTDSTDTVCDALLKGETTGTLARSWDPFVPPGLAEGQHRLCWKGKAQEQQNTSLFMYLCSKGSLPELLKEV